MCKQYGHDINVFNIQFPWHCSGKLVLDMCKGNSKLIRNMHHLYKIVPTEPPPARCHSQKRSWWVLYYQEKKNWLPGIWWSYIYPPTRVKNIQSKCRRRWYNRLTSWKLRWRHNTASKASYFSSFHQSVLYAWNFLNLLKSTTKVSGGWW